MSSPVRLSSHELLSSLASHNANETTLLDEFQQSGLDPELSGNGDLRSQLEQVAASNYHQFIAAASCLSQCRAETTEISSSLMLLQELTNNLILRIRSYTSDNSSQVSEAAIQSALNECYPLLMNILEMPYLMEACIAEQAYGEALDIRDHAKSLIRRNPEIAVLSIIGSAIDRNTDLMIQDLLNILEHVVELPISLQIIGHIRRIGRYREDEIQMLFLQRREIFLESKLASESSSGSSPLSSAIRYLDLIRINLFEIVTQFQAMFTVDNGLLKLWVSHRMENILYMLHTQLSLINNGPSIASLLEQAMYCGMSLGTIGIDFRALLIPLFHEKVIEVFSIAMENSFQLFTKSLYSHSWYVDKESLVKVCISVPEQSPVVLAEDLFLFPPLAILVNSVFEALNRIRDCIFVYVQPAVANQLQDLLLKCATHLSCTPPEDRLMELCHVFCDIVLPTCEQALDIVSPSNFRMDREKVIGPLRVAKLYMIAENMENNSHMPIEQKENTVLASS